MFWGARNVYADLLSRLKYREFRVLARKNGKSFTGRARKIPERIWPPQDTVFKQLDAKKVKAGKSARLRKTNADCKGAADWPAAQART